MSKNNLFNIAIAGGQCTGKSTLAAFLFATLKVKRFDFDLVGEEKRKLARELGAYRSPFERLYMWRQQQREELRSTAENGFITDYPLFQFYTSARLHSTSSRDTLAVRELYRLCSELSPDYYRLIVMAENPDEIPYRTDGARKGGRERALKSHQAIRSY